MKRSPLKRTTPLAAARSSIQRKQRVTTEQDAARKRTVKRAAKSKKPKLPSTQYVQSLFNRMVRERGDWKCVVDGDDFSAPDRQRLLHASHFWNVGHTAVRFDFDNVDPICYPHHFGQMLTGWEYNKQGRYRDFMIQKLGQEGYDALEQKAQVRVKLADVKQEFMEWYKANKDTAMHDSQIENESTAGSMGELEKAA